MRAQLAQQKNPPPASTPWPTTLHPQCAHTGASRWMAHSKLSNMWRLPPAVYPVLATIVIFVPLRRDFDPAGLPALLLGSVLGTPLGVWMLAALPANTLTRLIGLVLLAVVALEWLGLYPARLAGRGWALGAGVAAGLLGAGVGTPGPPVVLYTASQGWSARTIKANLQAFFLVNQVVIMIGYWWAGLLTTEVWRYAAVFLVPATLGLLLGMALFARVDQTRFRRIVFAILFASGLLLVVRG